MRLIGGNMNKKLLIILSIILILTATFAGCFGKSEDKGSKGPQFEEATGEYPAETGWLESGTAEARENDQIYVEVDSEITIVLNDTNVYSVSVQLSFSDYDDAHTGSDGASPADEVEVSITTPGFNETSSGTTPCSINFNLMGNDTGDDLQESLPSELTFHVYAKCFCEITYPKTGRPSAINFYQRDNGVAYEMMASYLYYEEMA